MIAFYFIAIAVIAIAASVTSCQGEKQRTENYKICMEHTPSEKCLDLLKK